jgi:hypothetical protein
VALSSGGSIYRVPNVKLLGNFYSQVSKDESAGKGSKKVDANFQENNVQVGKTHTTWSTSRKKQDCCWTLCADKEKILFRKPKFRFCTRSTVEIVARYQ